MTGALPNAAGSTPFSKSLNAPILVLAVSLAITFGAVRNAGAALPASALWNIGSGWTLNAVYLKPDGTWTMPAMWRFTIESVDARTVGIAFDGSGSSQGMLTVDRNTASIIRVRWIDTLKGETVDRELRFSGGAPVYPLLSAIPYYFPASAGMAANETFRLERSLNGRAIGTETLTQAVTDVAVAALQDGLPREVVGVLDNVLGDIPDTTMFQRIEVLKNSEAVFVQFWTHGFPWAIYTQSPTCRAWLVEVTP